MPDSTTRNSNAQASNGYDNPWESAANDENYRSSALRSGYTPEDTDSSGDVAPVSCKTHCIWWNQLFEGFLGALFVVFFFFQYRNSGGSGDALGTTILVLSGLLAILLLIRSIFGGALLLLNLNSRPCVSFLYLLTGGLLYLYGSKAPESWIMKLQKGHRTILPIAFAVFAALDVVYYFVLRHYYLQEVQEEAAQRNARYSRRTSSRFAPWWWSSNNNHNNNARLDENLEEPLMGNGQPSWTSNASRYRMNHGTVSSSSWWPFFRRSDDGSGVRDDGSVDYASLNEDWASRSEADPYWWSREDDR
eukprot:scaffold2182_cov73-Cylindrotheca_fusiformis.AAC.1